MTNQNARIVVLVDEKSFNDFDISDIDEAKKFALACKSKYPKCLVELYLVTFIQEIYI